MRVVSLLHSATEIVVALGARDKLVGVSHSCGAQWAHLPRLTHTHIDIAAPSAVIDAQVKSSRDALYELDAAQLIALAPDVVITQELCDVCAVASRDVEAALAACASPPVLVTLTPERLADIPQGFADVAMALNMPEQGYNLIAHWETTLAQYANRFAAMPLRIGFLDWLCPPFAAGHWIPDMIEHLGCVSVLATRGEPSYETDWKTINAAQPDLVLAACCGYDVARTQIDAESLAQSPLQPPSQSPLQPPLQPSSQSPLEARSEFLTCPLHILDGVDLFSCPSPRLLDSLALLAETVRTEIERAEIATRSFAEHSRR